MESKLGRTCQNPEVEVTEAIGGDQDVGLDHDGQEANEGQCDQQDRGDGGDCSLHQVALDGISRYDSNWNKDCHQERKNLVMALATAEAVAEEDKDRSKHDGDE